MTGSTIIIAALLAAIIILLFALINRVEKVRLLIIEQGKAQAAQSRDEI